jgi:hypothetical protein
MKKAEIVFSNNDVYILESINNNIIINNSDNGLIILSLDLEKVVTFSLDEPVYIYSIFKNSNGNELFLYCPDEKKLIYIDIINQKIKYIDIDCVLGILSPIYHWKNHLLIIATYEDTFYCLNIIDGEIKVVSAEFANSAFPLFYNFWKATQKCIPLSQVNASEDSFIYIDDDAKTVVHYDFLNNKKTCIENPSFKYHDINFYNRFFVFISEKMIEIKERESSCCLLQEAPNYIFLRAFFIKQNDAFFLFVLISNQSNNKINKIFKYCLE